VGESQSLMVVQWFDTMTEQLSFVDTPLMKATLSLNVSDANEQIVLCGDLHSTPLNP
jgi:hypothetical protein